MNHCQVRRLGDIHVARRHSIDFVNHVWQCGVLRQDEFEMNLSVPLRLTYLSCSKMVGDERIIEFCMTVRTLDWGEMPSPFTSSPG